MASTDRVSTGFHTVPLRAVGGVLRSRRVMGAQNWNQRAEKDLWPEDPRFDYRMCPRLVQFTVASLGAVR